MNSAPGEMTAEIAPPAIQGPRPLPLHLALTTLLSMNSIAALSSLRNGSLSWNPELAAKAHDLTEALATFSPDEVAKAVETELCHRMSGFANGVQLYRRTLREPAAPVNVIHSIGTTRLLDFGTDLVADAPPVLIIPSLVNRYTVLDLGNGQSFIRMLAAQGFHPYVVDWGAPGEEEKSFDLTAYITARLEPLLAVVHARTGNRTIDLIGYCMGGLLALAVGARQQDKISTLTLLATPWDFHTGHAAQIRMLVSMMPQLDALIDLMGEFPVEVLQAMFTSLDPWLTLEKFQRFSRMEPDSEKARAFIGLEDWLNDGVPLAGPAARDCLQGWYVENHPLKGRWKIDGTPVLPQNIHFPTLSVIPGRDHIVPPASARALADALPLSEAIVAEAGHIGMVAGGRAKKILHDPLVAWLKKNQRN